jgi:hypothetical protein
MTTSEVSTLKVAHRQIRGEFHEGKNKLVIVIVRLTDPRLLPGLGFRV